MKRLKSSGRFKDCSVFSLVGSLLPDANERFVTGQESKILTRWPNNKYNPLTVINASNLIYGLFSIVVLGQSLKLELNLTV